MRRLATTLALALSGAFLAGCLGVGSDETEPAPTANGHRRGGDDPASHALADESTRPRSHRDLP